MLYTTHLYHIGYFHIQNEMIAVNTVEVIEKTQIQSCKWTQMGQMERPTDGQVETNKPTPPSQQLCITHWGRVTHICIGKLTIIGSDNGLSPEWYQAIIWTNAGILLIWPLGTNFSDILIEIQTFSLKKIRLKISSAKCCSFRRGLNVLISTVVTGVLVSVIPSTEYTSRHFQLFMSYDFRCWLYSLLHKYIFSSYFFVHPKMAWVIEIQPHKSHSIFLSYLINIRVADDLMTQGARASAAMFFTQFIGNYHMTHMIKSSWQTILHEVFSPHKVSPTTPWYFLSYVPKQITDTPVD